MRIKTWSLATLLLSLCCACSDRPSSPPNIVVFLADDLGWGDVGFHGSEIETPSLDRLATRSLELSSFYVQPVCSPTRAALLTGRYPIRYGLQAGVIRPWSTSSLASSETLLPELLQEAGYTTHIVGKWHLGAALQEQLPTQRGFDHHYGQYTGLIDYWTHERLGGLDWHRDEKPIREEGYATDLLRDEAVRVVREHDYSQPLFLYVPFSAPHFPLQAPAKRVEYYARKIEDPERGVYAAMVTEMDQAIGAILDQLDASDQRENTLVLFFSDNGAYLAKGGSNGKLRGQKSDLYEGAIRAPALLSWPGHYAEGETLNTPIHVTDWVPTLTTLALGENPKRAVDLELDGSDLSAHLAERGPFRERTLLLNTQRKQGALRMGRWKILVHHHLRALADRDQDPLFGIELYDLGADPGERNNLASSQPAVRELLFERLMAYHAERAPVPEDRGLAPEGYQAPAAFGPSSEGD